ncbi:MAG: hypothetical protein JJE07_04050 [Flavobacteriaceae bacterium]|nr:hypothetical protein [Flavobacteriaceae bacterium]
MEILFRTKSESNQQQRESFLKLSPAKRFEKFLEMMEAFEIFPVKGNLGEKEKRRENRKEIIEERGKSNFIIQIKQQGDR